MEDSGNVNWPVLDLIGIQEGTDKSSLIGGYLRTYDRIFGGLRDREFNLIEIGVADGASVRMWERFLSRAHIIGVDIDPKCLAYATERVTIEIGSQNDPNFLHALSVAYPPTVVIDDGSHSSYDIIFTFERLFPALLPGGIYVIEDLHFHLDPTEAERLRGGSDILANEYVTELVAARLGNEYTIPSLPGIRRHLVGTIDRVEVIGQAAIFHKRQNVNAKDAIETARPYVESSSVWFNFFQFARWLQNAGYPASQVEDMFRRAIALNPSAIICYDRLSESLEARGDIPAAIAVAQEASSVAVGQPGVAARLRDRIAWLQARQEQSGK